MEITLYNNTSEKNKIGKSLTVVSVLEGTLRDESSITNPEILIEYNDPIAFNYCFIDSFNRYYFVNDVIAVRAGLIRLILSVDVLESFKTQILSQNAIIERNADQYEKYFSDENYRTLVKTKTDILNFPNGLLESGEFILITAGGGA